MKSARLWLVLVMIACSLMFACSKGGGGSGDGGTGDGGCVTLGGTCGMAGSGECCSDLWCDSEDTNKCQSCIPVPDNCTGLKDNACCQGADPLKGSWCEPNTEGTAYFCKQCSKAASTCATNLDCCPPIAKDDKTLICGSDLLCKAACTSDSECVSPKICMPNGECQAASCSSKEDCGGQYCCVSAAGATCKADCGYGPADKCRITSIGGILFNSNEIELSAVGYNSSTNTMVPGTAITWTVADNVANGCVLDTDGGIKQIKGGNGDAGTCTVTAKTGSILCTNNSGITDAGTIVFNNAKAAASGVTVFVYDQDTGLPIPGAEVWTASAKVACNEAGNVTDADGKCTFPTGTTDNVHVRVTTSCMGTAPCYEAVSVVGVTKNTYVIHLPRAKLNPDISQTLLGGIKGITADKNGVDLAADTLNALWLSYTGTSIFGNIQDMPFTILGGDMLNSKLQITTPVTYSLIIPLPSGVRAAAPLLQITALPKNNLVGTNYMMSAMPGLRTAWAFGGGFDSKMIGALIPIVMTIVGECTDLSKCPIGKVLVLALPVINALGQSVVSAVDLPAKATIPTKCIDNATAFASCTPKTAAPDGGTAYCPGTVSQPSCNPPMVDNAFMSDYNNLTNLVMKITAKMTLRTKWTIPELPSIPNPNLVNNNICMDGAGVMAAGNVPGVGIIPLGLTAGVVQPDPTKTEANCKIHWAAAENPDQLAESQVMLRMVPLQQGLEGNSYMYAVMATNFSSLFAGSYSISGLVVKGEASVGSEKNISDRAFLSLATGAALNRGNGTNAGTVTPAAAVTGASFYRYRINDDYEVTPDVSKKVYNQWTIYAPTTVTTAITLPAWDLAKDAKALMSAHVYKSSVALSDLVSEASGKHLNSLFDVTDAFSHATCAVKCTKTDPKLCAEKTVINPACTLQ